MASRTSASSWKESMATFWTPRRRARPPPKKNVPLEKEVA